MSVTDALVQGPDECDSYQLQLPPSSHVPSSVVFFSDKPGTVLPQDLCLCFFLFMVPPSPIPAARSVSSFPSPEYDLRESLRGHPGFRHS